MAQTENSNHVPVAMHNDSQQGKTLQAMIELNQRYQEDTKHYAQEIQNFNLQIETLKNDIEEAIEEKKEQEEECAKVTSEIGFQSRIIAESNDAFHQAIASLDELEIEYKESMEASEYMHIVKKKKHALQKLLDNIEAQEAALLNYELERLNILELLAPKRKHVEQLQKQLKTLEQEKLHFESNQLQQVLQIPMQTPSTVEVIDIDTVEE